VCCCCWLHVHAASVRWTAKHMRFTHAGRNVSSREEVSLEIIGDNEGQSGETGETGEVQSIL
jgi:hypothetical protein